MPKRRSLVGTGREALGQTSAAQPQTLAAARPKKDEPKHPRRTAISAGNEAAPKAIPAPPSVQVAPKHERASTSGPTSAYEAMMGFASATLRQNLETGARLAGCKSPMDIFATQTAHAAALTQSFISASLKLMQLGMSTGTWSRKE